MLRVSKQLNDCDICIYVVHSCILARRKHSPMFCQTDQINIRSSLYETISLPRHEAWSSNLRPFSSIWLAGLGENYLANQMLHSNYRAELYNLGYRSPFMPLMIKPRREIRVINILQVELYPLFRITGFAFSVNIRTLFDTFRVYSFTENISLNHGLYLNQIEIY